VDPLGTVTCTRLDDPSGPCVTNAEAIRNYTGVPAPDPAAPPSDPGGVPGLTVAPVKPPVIAPRPPAPIPPGVRAAGRLGGIAGVLACVLFCLSGDSAPDDEQLRIDTDERKKHCLDNDSPPTAPTYFELQDGRATGVEACLGPWSTTVDHRPPPTPLGFLPGMNRSHLLARTLGGHSILENIVPMWEYANKSGMATMENRFRRLINQEGRVYVFTAPIYPKTSHPEWKELGEAPWAVSYTYATRSSVQGPQVVLNDP